MYEVTCNGIQIQKYLSLFLPDKYQTFTQYDITVHIQTYVYCEFSS
jgi:hypothetical protein